MAEKLEEQTDGVAIRGRATAGSPSPWGRGRRGSDISRGQGRAEWQRLETLVALACHPSQGAHTASRPAHYMAQEKENPRCLLSRAFPAPPKTLAET